MKNINTFVDQIFYPIFLKSDFIGILAFVTAYAWWKNSYWYNFIFKDQFGSLIIIKWYIFVADYVYK